MSDLDLRARQPGMIFRRNALTTDIHAQRRDGSSEHLRDCVSSGLSASPRLWRYPLSHDAVRTLELALDDTLGTTGPSPTWNHVRSCASTVIVCKYCVNKPYGSWRYAPG